MLKLDGMFSEEVIDKFKEIDILPISAPQQVENLNR